MTQEKKKGVLEALFGLERTPRIALKSDADEKQKAAQVKNESKATKKSHKS